MMGMVGVMPGGTEGMETPMTAQERPLRGMLPATAMTSPTILNRGQEDMRTPLATLPTLQGYNSDMRAATVTLAIDLTWVIPPI